MSNSEDQTATKNNKNREEAPNPAPIPPPPGADVEERPVPVSGRRGLGMSSITGRWKREDLMARGSVWLRWVGLVFSLLAFIIMASNKHGDWKNFDRYEEYRYLLAISILSTLYTGAQSIKHALELSTGNYVLQNRNSALLDFVGDQVTAYLLISAASSAVPLTNRMREGTDNIFTDASAASISMAFFAFFSLGLSALVSGYKLSAQSYI